jgi:plasmid maintenance system antidote protein VapI
VTDINEGKQPITPNLAIRLGIALSTSSRFWMNLQVAFDLRTEEILLDKSLEETVKVLNKV